MKRASSKRARFWVLRQVGDLYWFREMGAIGPRCTAVREDAERFQTKQEAMRSPACSFTLTNFQPEAVR